MNIDRVEYKVVAAPARGKMSWRMKSGKKRFAETFEAILNEMASDGWHYLRTEALPLEERAGLSKFELRPQYLMVFQRPESQQISQPELSNEPKATPALTASRSEPPMRIASTPEQPADVVDLERAARETQRKSVLEDVVRASPVKKDHPSET